MKPEDMMAPEGAMPVEQDRGAGDWEAQNMIYSPEEYDMFYDLLEDELEEDDGSFENDEMIDDLLDDQEIVDAYNEIKEGAPNITPEQLAQIIPKIAQLVEGKMGGAPEEAEGKMAALNSIPME